MRTIHQKQEHTGSYYAATVNEKTDYPVLEGAVSADICVVGAGFTGVSTVLGLAVVALGGAEPVVVTFGVVGTDLEGPGVAAVGRGGVVGIHEL